MTYQQIYNMLSSIRLNTVSTATIPAVVTAWPINEVPGFPYIVITYPENDDIIADNINFIKRVQCNIELYTENKTPDIEALVEATLASNALQYNKTSAYLDSEHMYQTLYITEVIL